MEVLTRAITEYKLDITMNEDELNQLLDEIEVIFLRAMKTNTGNEIERLIELKNLLVMSINNNQS